MKLFLILYLGTKIAGVAGPLPYDIDECRARAYDMNADVAKAIYFGRSTNGNNLPIPQKTIDMFKELKYVCEYYKTRPKIEDK